MLPACNFFGDLLIFYLLPPSVVWLVGHLLEAQGLAGSLCMELPLIYTRPGSIRQEERDALSP